MFMESAVFLSPEDATSDELHLSLPFLLLEKRDFVARP